MALTSQAAHADPKPTKSEVKAKVDKLYHEAEEVTEKYNGAKEQQDKLKKQAAGRVAPEDPGEAAHPRAAAHGGAGQARRPRRRP